MNNFKKSTLLLFLLTVFLFFSLILFLNFLKFPVKIENKAAPLALPQEEKFNPPSIDHEYQIIAHGFHNFKGNIPIEGSIYAPEFTQFINKKICDISNGLEGKESEVCNVANEGGPQIERLSGQTGLVLRYGTGNKQCDFSDNFQDTNKDGKPDYAIYPNRQADWSTWINFIKEVKKTGIEPLISVDFPMECEDDNKSNGDFRHSTEELSYYFEALVKTAFEKLAEEGLPSNYIKYWNFHNEPGVGRLTQTTPDGKYLLSVTTEKASRVVKTNCPECKVILAGPGSYPGGGYLESNKANLENFFKKFFSELKEKNVDFDAFDIHWHHQCLGPEKKLQYYDIKDYLKWYSDIAGKYFNLQTKEFWITENSEAILENPSTYSLIDVCGRTATNVISQKEQASNLIKRALVAFASGVKKISYSSNLIEATFGTPSSYFSHIGILDREGNERLSFKGGEILAERIYGAIKIEWDTSSLPLEKIIITHDDNQKSYVLWTRSGAKEINPYSYLNILPQEFYNLVRIENINGQDTWKKSFSNSNRLLIDSTPVFIYPSLNCSSINISYNISETYLTELPKENNIPVLTLNQNDNFILSITASSSKRKLKKLSLRIKDVNNSQCDQINLVKSWVSPSFVKEINGEFNLNDLLSKYSQGDYYLFVVISDDVAACSGDPSASANNNFCTARRGKLENGVLLKIRIGGQTFPSSTPTPTSNPCPNGDVGNLDCDPHGKVNDPDLTILSQSWAPTGPVPPPSSGKHTADLNNDGKVDEIDLTILLKNWKN